MNDKSPFNHRTIAEFMGINTWQHTPESVTVMAMVNGASGSIIDICPYHKDFNLIIEVAKKIENLGYHVSFSSRQAQVCDKNWNLIIDADFCDTFEENAYSCLVSFIEWHNKKQLDEKV